MNKDGNRHRNIPDTSPSLLLRIRNPSDKESWTTFERIYGEVVRKYCRSWALQAADVEDITQDVLSTVATTIRKFDYDPNKGKFRGWLGTVTSNKIKRHLGKERKHDCPKDAGSLADERVSADPDTQWVDVFCEVVLKEACSIARTFFEENTWRCFELTWIERKSPEEVAGILEVAVHSVYVNKSRVLKKLEQIVRELADDLAYAPPTA